MVEHEGDSIKGPLTVSFAASKGAAKFNTFEVKDASGASVIAFSASELAEPFSAAAVRIAEISEPPIWRDPSQRWQARENDLIRRMSLAEKVAQLQNTAPGITRLGLPAMITGTRRCTAWPRMAPRPFLASHRHGLHLEPAIDPSGRTVIGIEGRAKFNDYASQHNGNCKCVYRSDVLVAEHQYLPRPALGPRPGETYGEDPFLTREIGVGFVAACRAMTRRYVLDHGVRETLCGPQRPGTDR